MHIPVEICDRLDHLFPISLRPVLISSQIAYYVWSDQGLRHEWGTVRHHAAFDAKTQKSLMNLRLVNKSFCRSTTPWVFRHVVAKYESFATGSPPLERLLKLSDSPYAKNVRQLDFGFSNANPSSESNDVSLYINPLFECLSSCLIKFPNLEALEFHEPHLGLSKNQKRDYMDTVALVLRSVPLPNLREPEVNFPLTHDFGRFFQDATVSTHIPIEDITKSLRHLGVCSTAYTSQFIPISPEYAAFPNQTHVTQMLNMVAIPPNLQFLAIENCNTLDIDSLIFPPTLCLRSLCLNGVSLSGIKLLILIKQSAERLSYVTFIDVNLNSGIWENVILSMRLFESILHLRVWGCGYSLTGASAHLDPGIPLGPELNTNINSTLYCDKNALKEVGYRVYQNRATLGLSLPKEIDHPMNICYSPLN